jgi:Ca-activated chloride channel family protein
MRSIFFVILLNITYKTQAFDWNALWQTPDQKAHVLMNKSQFAQAEATFDNPEWKALAAFRAGHYKKAATLYAQLKNNDYNRGNALAHAGQLEAAIQAYDKALARNPNDQDAIFNRNIVTELLKKQQKQDQDKQQKQFDNKSNNRTENNQEQQDKKQEAQNKENQQDQQNSANPQKKQEKNEQGKNKKDIKSTSKSKQESNLSPEEQEQQQAKKQWLKLIPDDPGGLMREKFLRDYLRRQQG